MKALPYILLAISSLAAITFSVVSLYLLFRNSKRSSEYFDAYLLSKQSANK